MQGQLTIEIKELNIENQYQWAVAFAQVFNLSHRELQAITTPTKVKI